MISLIQAFNNFVDEYEILPRASRFFFGLDGEEDEYVLCLENKLAISVSAVGALYAAACKDSSIGANSKCILLLNPSCHTVWLQRRQIAANCEDEIQLTEVCLNKHPKCGEAWAQRRFYVNVASIDKEEAFVLTQIENRPFHYYALNHWQKIRQLLKLAPKPLTIDEEDYYGAKFYHLECVQSLDDFARHFEINTRALERNPHSDALWEYRGALIAHILDLQEENKIDAVDVHALWEAEQKWRRPTYICHLLMELFLHDHLAKDQIASRVSQLDVSPAWRRLFECG